MGNTLGKPKYLRTELYKPEEILEMIEKSEHIGKTWAWQTQALIALSAIWGKRIIENVRLRRTDVEILRCKIRVRFQVAKKKRKTWDGDLGQVHFKEISLQHPLSKILVRYIKNFDHTVKDWDLDVFTENLKCVKCGSEWKYGIKVAVFFKPKLDTLREVNKRIETENLKCPQCGVQFEKIKVNPYLFPNFKTKEKTLTVKGHVSQQHINPDGSILKSKAEKIYSYKREAGHISPQRALYYLKKITGKENYWHLFRSTLATSYASRNASEYKIMSFFDWDDPKVASGYVRKAGVQNKEMEKRKWIT